MRGYPYNFDASPSKVAVVLLNAHPVGEVSVRTAATEEYEVIILCRKTELEAVPMLALEAKPFPNNPDDPNVITPIFLHGLRYDGKPFVLHREDAVSGDVIFRPLVTAIVDVQEGQERMDNEGGGSVVGKVGPTGIELGGRPGPRVGLLDPGCGCHTGQCSPQREHVHSVGHDSRTGYTEVNGKAEAFGNHTADNWPIGGDGTGNDPYPDAPGGPNIVGLSLNSEAVEEGANLPPYLNN
jgi:hypothetical protein